MTSYLSLTLMNVVGGGGGVAAGLDTDAPGGNWSGNPPLHYATQLLETWPIPRAQRRAGEGNSGPRGDRSTRCGDCQARRVAPAYPRNNIWDFCPEKRSAMNS